MTSSEEPVALLIEFDLATGKRAGNIDPYDRGLLCLAQNLDVTPALEIRLIIDGRDPTQYEGITGITILRGKDVINTKIDEIVKPRYVITHPELFRRHCDEKRIVLMDIIKDIIALYPDITLEELTQKALETLYNMGVIGIRKQFPARKL